MCCRHWPTPSAVPPPPALAPRSCLGAEADAPSRRLRTKAAGEEVVRAELGPIATIFKPAAMTGTEARWTGPGGVLADGRRAGMVASRLRPHSPS